MGTRISSSARARLLLGAALASIVGAVWFSAQLQRDAADDAFEASRLGQRMLTAMLDQETGLRGHLLTGEAPFLAPYRLGVADFDRSVDEARELASGELEERLDRQVAAARQWQRRAERQLADFEADRTAGRDPEAAAARKRVFDRFRDLNRDVQADLAAQKDRELARATTVSVALVLGIGVLFALVGYGTIERQAVRDRRRREAAKEYRAGQTEFYAAMQVARDEPEAYGLVKRHLERTIRGAEITILNRNNSDNRLVPALPLPAGSPLAPRVADATPGSCLAVRLGRTHQSGAERDPLLACDLCGGLDGEIACVPSLVGGEVIGAVLARHDRPLAPDEAERIGESVGRSAPVLANLRMLAIAEARAATDALTGLPNARSCRDTLKRMVAHAGRAVSPLSAVLVDLDHFKQINDRFGHGAGDDVLAAVGQVLAATLRTSDFCGRAGGEEFLILLPDTDHEGAIQAAEKLRAAIALIEIPRVDRAITASLGVATYPLDAPDGDALVRQADRALYAAKAAGRNRVELAAGAPVPEPVGDPIA